MILLCIFDSFLFIKPKYFVYTLFWQYSRFGHRHLHAKVIASLRSPVKCHCSRDAPAFLHPARQLAHAVETGFGVGVGLPVSAVALLPCREYSVAEVMSGLPGYADMICHESVVLELDYSVGVVYWGCV